MKKKDVKYSLYLVTDSTPAILGDRNLCDVVEAALKGGVTCVQYRDKTSETAELINVARRLHDITKRYGVPLIINDRVDVAQAVGCEGVHIGQDDMELSMARRILGPDAIIGVTASSIDEALRACHGGADYLGLGTVYATPTKTNTKSIIGTAGVRLILKALYQDSFDIPTVCIGGINSSNIKRVKYQASDSAKRLNGVAVVSAIISAADPETEARKLLRLLEPQPQFGHMFSDIKPDVNGILALAPTVIKAVHDTTPLSHNMTNLVVQNFAANVALAVGASPIMSNNGEEGSDLAKLGGSLVINMGTVTPESLKNYIMAMRAYNEVSQPVVFDPVGAGATSVRRAAVSTIMDAGYLDVIKGNEGEIKTLSKDTSEEQQRGVDSSSTLSPEDKAEMVLSMAGWEKNIVVMTGKTDYVSDGQRVFAIDNGHEYLGMVTGTGCVLGTTISAMVAVPSKDKTAAVIAGILLFEIAAELAAERPDVQGPGTFVAAFIDELHRLRKATASGDRSWLARAKLSQVR